MEPQQILDRFEATPWQTLPKAKDLRAFLDTMGLTSDDIPGIAKDEILASINQYLTYCRFAIRNNWSPNPKSPSAAKTDKSPDQLPTMAALDDAVSLKQDTQPTAVSMDIRDSVVRDDSPSPQTDNIQPQPEPVKEEDRSVSPMERATPLHVTIALNRRVDDLDVNHKSLTAAHLEHVRKVSDFTKEVVNDLKTQDICTRELQDKLQIVQMELTALRRDGYRNELRIRADHVLEAQRGPQGGEQYASGGTDDTMTALALKMAGKSPTSLPHFSMIGVDSKTSRVGAAAVAFTKFQAESRTWNGTIYGLDRVDQQPLCDLLRSARGSATLARG